MEGGEIDLIIVPALISHIEHNHEIPGYTQFLRRLNAFSRVITFDKRGQGMSDRIGAPPSLEERMDDIRAVMSATDSSKAVLFGHSDGGTMSALFAATYPDRVQSLILYGAFAKSYSTEDYPHMPSFEKRWQGVNNWIENWGKGLCIGINAPELANDVEVVAAFGRWERLSGTPASMRRYFEVVIETDIREILPTISVPTLVVHRSEDPQVPIAAGRHLAEAIENARFVELADGTHGFQSGNQELFVGEVEEFLTGVRTKSAIAERVLATVMFTDIVDSTQHLAARGDGEWRQTLDRHDAMSKQMIETHGGHIIKSTGDGILATFDGPGRAIHCACSLGERVKSLNIEIRTGMHTSEIEIRGDDISGLAVHVASRIMDHANAGEVLVSRIVTDLVAGSESFDFNQRGEHTLKGLPGDWQLLSAALN
jgi:class 3 adenylate cyclase